MNSIHHYEDLHENSENLSKVTRFMVFQILDVAKCIQSHVKKEKRRENGY